MKMTPLTDQQRDCWSVISEEGLLRFIVFKSIARIGALFGVLNFLLTYFLSPETLLGISGEILKFLFNTTFFGVVFSLLIWHINQKRHMSGDQ